MPATKRLDHRSAVQNSVVDDRKLSPGRRHRRPEKGKLAIAFESLVIIILMTLALLGTTFFALRVGAAVMRFFG